MKIKTGEGEVLKEMLVHYLKEKGGQERAAKNTSLLIAIAVFLLVTMATYYFSLLWIAIILTFFYIVIFAMALISVHVKYDADFSTLQEIIKNSICSLYMLNEIEKIIIEFGIYPKNFVALPEEHQAIISETFKTFFSTLSEYEIYISFYPITQKSNQVDNTPFDELLKIVDNEVNKAAASLPEEIKEKGVEMSKAYLYVYCVENTLRLFIHQQSELRYGSSYMNHIIINFKVKKKVQDRKDEEVRNKFLTTRGSSDLFYMDFKELGDVILGNPDLLSFFPNEIWVKAKIDELGSIRNLIAHNSLIGTHEINILKTNYQSILKQIGRA